MNQEDKREPPHERDFTFLSTATLTLRLEVLLDADKYEDYQEISTLWDSQYTKYEAKFWWLLALIPLRQEI